MIICDTIIIKTIKRERVVLKPIIKSFRTEGEPGQQVLNVTQNTAEAGNTI